MSAMIEETHLEHQERQLQERVLWRAVLLRAIQDATASPGARVAQDERRTARLFLTDTFGAFAASRVRVCDAADMCPRMVRDKALELIAEADRGQV